MVTRGQDMPMGIVTDIIYEDICNVVWLLRGGNKMSHVHFAKDLTKKYNKK